MIMKIKRYDYAQQFGADIEQLLEAIRSMLLSGDYILTSEVKQFETEFSDYIGSTHVLGVNSGTDALILALMALGIGRGDEVITQANTFYATVAAICFVGAKPVLVDALEDSFLIDESQIESAITARTKAIIPVHLFGKATPMKRILAIAQQYSLFVVEDAAQSHGAKIDGQAVGTFGDVGCFSFHPSKNFAAAGDAGAVVTNNSELAERVRIIRSLGQREQNQHVALGLNSKLDAIQSRILSWKLPQLDSWNSARRRVAQIYRDQLADQPIEFQEHNQDNEHVYHLLQIRTENRDRLLAHLVRDGIDVTIRYPTPIHLQDAFTDQGWSRGQFPVAEKLAKELLCLPIRPDMLTQEIGYVCNSIKRFFGATPK